MQSHRVMIESEKKPGFMHRPLFTWVPGWVWAWVCYLLLSATMVSQWWNLYLGIKDGEVLAEDSVTNEVVEFSKDSDLWGFISAMVGTSLLTLVLTIVWLTCTGGTLFYFYYLTKSDNRCSMEDNLRRKNGTTE